MAQAEENPHPALTDAASKIYCDESIHNIWRTFYEVTGAFLMGQIFRFFPLSVVNIKASFTRAMNATVFVNGTLDLSNVMFKHYRIVLNSFLNGAKINTDVDGTCK